MLTVLIDNGHGKDTPGKRSPVWPDGTQLFEYEFNRRLAVRLLELCKEHAGLQPVIIVPELNDVGLTARAKRANNFKNHNAVLVSLHGNAGPEPAHGWEVWTAPGQTKSDKLAEFIYEEVAKSNLGLAMRSDKTDGDHDKEARFTMLTATAMPAVLTENGFFTNEAECHRMMTDEFVTEIAAAHVRGLLRYGEFYKLL